jgi:hypothetical protein
LAECIAGDGAPPPDTHVVPAPADVESSYYRAWAAALEGVLLERDLVDEGEITAMAELVASGAIDHTVGESM